MSNGPMRDDFSAAVRDALGKRVGLRCSLPDCRATTSGPHSDPARVVNVGVACHITAASEGGPRYDPTITAEQRAAPENGIWLCQTHAKLIDNDAPRYTVEILRAWKEVSEHLMQQELGATVAPQDRNALATRGRLTAVLLDATAHFDRLSEMGATGLDPDGAEVARQIEHRIGDIVIDVLTLNAHPLFDAADRQETAIAVKSMKAALRVRGFQYRYGYVDYDEDIFRAYVEAQQNEYLLDSPEQARGQFVDALEQFERLTGIRTVRVEIA